MIEYNIFHELAYNWMVVLYFFLGGLAAGSFLIGFILRYGSDKYKDLGRILGIASPFILGLGMLFLLFDLGKIFRFYTLFLNFVPTSAVSWGSFLLNIFIIIGFLQAWFLFKEQDKTAKIFGFAGLPFAFLVSGYTGIILAQMPGRPLWNIIFTPALFIWGGIISALALAVLIGVVLGTKTELLVSLGKILAGLIAIELALIAIELIVIGSGPEAKFLPLLLLTGRFAFSFWVFEILLGAGVPVYIFLNTKLSAKANLQSIAAALTLFGIFAMRYIVVIASQKLM